MKQKLILLLFAIWFSNVNAQNSNSEIVSSAGETYQGNSMQIDWTLGELGITTIKDLTNQITQGFHQPNYTITSVNELPREIGDINIYPNPTPDRIEIKIDFEQYHNVKIQLIDLYGRLIWSKERNGNQLEQIMDATRLQNGNYLLKFLIDGNQYSQTFKIQKLN